MSENSQLPALPTEDDIKTIVSSASQALQKNTSQSTTALNALIAFVNKWKDIALSAEAAQEAVGLLKKVRGTKDDMNNRRTSFTKLLDGMISSFTTLENKIDPKKSAEVTAVQKLLDDYNTNLLRQQQLKEQEEQKKLAIAQEKIDLKAELVIALGNHYLNFVALQRQMLMDLYNELTLDNFERQSALLKQFNIIYPYSHLQEFKFQTKRSWSLDDESKKEIWLSVKQGKHEEYQRSFRSTIEADIQQLSDKLPAKKKELEEIAKADTAKKERLLKEQQEREEENKKKLAAEAEQKQQESINTATTNKAVEEVNTLFDHNANAEVVEAPTGSIRKVCDIKLKNNAGWLAILAFYMQNEGTASKADLSKKTFDSCKTFAEKKYLKDGIKIENPLLDYDESVKTISK